MPATLAAMNSTALQIGAFDTIAGTPSGLDVTGQSSSPYDLALVMRRLVEDSYTRDVLQTRVADIPGVPGVAQGYQIQNQDSLLADYPGTLGGKTGFTDAARHTFVAAAERDGRRLVVSLMQAERRPVHELEQARRLLDWGFATPAGVGGVGRLVDPAEAATLTRPPPSPTPSATPTPAVAAAPAVPQVAAPPVSTVAGESPLLPLGLAAGALVVVAGTLVGRRRARRPAHGAAVSPPPEDAGGRRPPV